MATSIYVASTEPFSGKSAVCVGLLRRFQRDGLKIGYMKPVSTQTRAAGSQVYDEDAHFVKYTFDLADLLEQMAPIHLDDQLMLGVLAGGNGAQDLQARLLAAFEAVSAGKDVVVLEGANNLRQGRLIELMPDHVVELLTARELAVVPYDSDLQVTDDLLVARQRLGDSLLGGVINRIPPERLGHVAEMVKPYVEKRGIPVFACLPCVESLRAATVSELAEGLDGEILCAHHVVDALVEHIMVGAMDSARAFPYFYQTPNKAVITSGDRTDLQLSALETSTRCLILTDNILPPPLILDRARELAVPVILTARDTFSAIEIAERYLGRHRFHLEEKVQQFDALLQQYFDFAALYQSLGLAVAA
jgi:hypothetical protein